jgi:hypothetical protein
MKEAARTAFSREFGETVWLNLRGDALAKIEEYASQGAMLFSADDSTHELHVRDRGSRTHRSLAFTWTQRSGFPLPPLEGSITATRFGPLTILFFRTRYASVPDAASRLLDESIGAGMARRTLRRVVKAVQWILRDAPRRGRRATEMLGTS